MKLYIVTETFCESRNLSRTWVCFTEEEAKNCLKHRYELATSFNKIGGKDAPTDTLQYGFFFWEQDNDMTLKYDIVTSQTFSEK